MGEVICFPVDFQESLGRHSTGTEQSIPLDPFNPPRIEMGRRAMFEGMDADACPFPMFSPSWWEWRKGYGQAWGMPEDTAGRLSLMLEISGHQDVALKAIRAIGSPEVVTLVDACRDAVRRPRGNLVSLQVSL